MVEHQFVYINGDSNSEGAYLDTPIKSWPYTLVESGISVINDSFGGGSNYRMMRTTVERLSENPFQYNIAIFGWTTITRYETPGPEDHYVRQYHNVAAEYILQENFIQQITTTHNLCRHLGITDWHFFSFDENPNPRDIPNTLHRERLEKKFKQLDTLRWILPPNTNLKLWGKEQGYILIEETHLPEEAQIEFGNLVKSKIYSENT